jgi:hypothetical protein
VRREIWHRLLDGPHVWGSFDAMVGRYGSRRYRLVVLSPGTDAAGRRLLRLYRAWPLGGGFLILLAAMLIGEAVSSSRTTLLAACAIYLGGEAMLFALTAGARGRLRSISVTLLAGEPEGVERQSYDQWETLVDLLTRADQQLEGGAITPAQHEALWWQAYDSLEVPARV